MKKLIDINPSLLDYDFNYKESNNYSKIAFGKYKDNVVSFKKTPKYYFVLLKGHKTFFGYKFKEDAKWVRRCFNMKVFTKKRGRVLDHKEFKLFIKRLILEELK